MAHWKRPKKVYIYNIARQVDVQKENELKGFSFSPNCKGFIVSNYQKAYNWAYQLGLGWTSNRGDIYNWFYSFMDPSLTCINYFRQNYSFISKKDVEFYANLVLSYFRGLAKSGLISYQWLMNDWAQFRFTTITKFKFSPKIFPETI